jgi:CheY-like chemotaxis protein
MTKTAQEGLEMQRAQVLIVEDDPDIADTLAMILEHHGHAAVLAENGAAALRRLRGGFRASIILLDLMMPVMDGQAFLLEADRIPGVSEVPVIVFSGDHARASAASGHSIVARLGKPIELDTLLDTIATHARP